MRPQSGRIFKRLNVRLRLNNGAIFTYQFSCGKDKVEDVSKELVACRNNYLEEAAKRAAPSGVAPIKAANVRVVIQEAKEDNATVILQERRARGEITVEEFHRLVNRT